MIKYIFTENIFQTINTPEKAYWIGFLYADGYVTNNGIFGCGLQEQDKKHLEKFLTFLGMCKEQIQECIKIDNSTHTVRINIGRKQTYQDLINLGFSNIKSYDKTLTVWNSIPKQYKKEFILGLWDGDGSFSITPADHIQVASLISNNDSLIHAIGGYINEYCQKDLVKIKERTLKDPYPRIRLSKNKAKYFGDWLYKEQYSFVLERKYNIYLQFREEREKARRGIENGMTKGIICIESGRKYATAKESAIGEFNKNNLGLLNNIRAVCRGEQKKCQGKSFRYMTPKEYKEFKNEIL